MIDCPFQLVNGFAEWLFANYSEVHAIFAKLKTDFQEELSSFEEFALEVYVESQP